MGFSLDPQACCVALLVALSRETHTPFLVRTPGMEGKQAAARMSLYPFRALFMQHSHVR